MNNSTKIEIKATGEIKTAIYATTPSGSKRYYVDGKPVSDKKFDSLYKIIRSK